MNSRRIVVSGVTPKLAGLHWDSESLLRIGRLESLEIVLQDPSISRRHAEIMATRRGWMIRDLGSASGTLINGTRLNGSEHRLHVDDELQCGNLTLKVTTLEEGTERPAQPTTPAEPVEARASTIKTSGSFVKVQATVQNSWDKALETVALGANGHMRQGQHLLTLLRTGYHLGRIASLDELLHSILQDTLKALDAQRAAIVLADDATGALQLRQVVYADEPRKPLRSYSKTLAERSYRLGESFLCRDVRDEEALVTAASVTHGSMSSIICAVLRSPRRKLGVLHLDRGPLQEPFSEDEFNLADAIAASVSVGIESAQMVQREREQFIQMVTALARTVEVRDQYTANHTHRVTDYALMIAQALRLPPAALHDLQIGTPLHDIGKIGIADAILRKPGQLTKEEFELMKSHTVKGAAILETIPALQPMLPIVRHHHERWDGAGYPDGLHGDRISLVARIVAVADAFDAMTSDRPYRRALPLETAFRELQLQSGTHFDPECTQAFLSLRARVEGMFGQSKSLVHLPESSSVIYRQAPMVYTLGGLSMT